MNKRFVTNFVFVCTVSAVLLISNVVFLPTGLPTERETTSVAVANERRIQSITKESHPASMTERLTGTTEQGVFRKLDVRETYGTVAVTKRWPPLQEIVSERDDTEIGILQDVSFLLDIAVLGHAKCATSYILDWLQNHPEIQMFDREACDLYDRKPAKLARRLYTELPPDNETHAFQRGFKCPGHFSRPALSYFNDYFSRTKLIVGLRHPVRYFESYYNFRYRHNRNNMTLPPAETLIGECTTAGQGICTNYAKFHVNLAKLGKTNWTEPEENKLLNLSPRYNQITHIPNPLFLYDVEQLYDTDVTRTAQFRVDLQQFLGLSTPLGSQEQQHVSSRGKVKALDICESNYDALRNELVAIGKRASLWIRKYLMEADTVTVSNPEHFQTILKTWQYDPCTDQSVETA
jgi:hypothetical protein